MSRDENAALAVEVQRAHGDERPARLQARRDGADHALITREEHTLEEHFVQGLAARIEPREARVDVPHALQVAIEIGPDQLLRHSRNLVLVPHHAFEQADLHLDRHAVEGFDLLLDGLQREDRLLLLLCHPKERVVEDHHRTLAR